MSHHPTTATVIDLFAIHGSSEYGGEAVTQEEHALQCAELAAAGGAPETLIAAALLHDIGHLLHDLPADAPERGIDDLHEALGGRWLESRFVSAVTEPVRLHVAAKRYLCATEPAYEAALSEPSRVSLALQGGPFTADEVAEFEQNPFWRDALRLRRWDDTGKISGLETRGVADFAAVLDACVVPDAG
ncbi:MAG: phosphonate degradation HD-domain oxygenase [Armatimonadota bacterium]